MQEGRGYRRCMGPAGIKVPTVQVGEASGWIYYALPLFRSERCSQQIEQIDERIDRLLRGSVEIA